MKKFFARSICFYNGDFFLIATQSTGMFTYGEPNAPLHYLPPDANDAQLGQTLRIALKASKQVAIEEFQKIWKSGILKNNEIEREARMMQEYGYKTKRAMYKHMVTCSVEVADGQIEISPSHSDRKGGHSRNANDEIENVRLPDTASDAELGAALREGFKRCTGAIALD